MSVWVAFGAGILVGSFLSMFTLALFIAGSEGASEQDPPARPHLDERAPDIIPIRTAPSERRGFTQQGA